MNWIRKKIKKRSNLRLLFHEYHTRDLPKVKNAGVLSEMGFRTFPRISPKYLDGIVLKSQRKCRTKQEIFNYYQIYCLARELGNYRFTYPDEPRLDSKTIGDTKSEISKLLGKVLPSAHSRAAELTNGTVECMDGKRDPKTLPIYLYDPNNYIPKIFEEVGSAEYTQLSEKVARAQLSINQDKPDRLLPIYDVYGSLLWPQKMSYEEVKQFMAERDQNKQLDSGSESGMTTSEEE